MPISAMTRLKVGKVYCNRNGYEYRCLDSSEAEAQLERISDGWQLTAHYVCIYADGTIEWGYSSGGHWPA